MRVFSHELKSRAKSVFFWSLGVGIFTAMAFGKYTAFTADPKAADEIMAQFPATIQAVFGMSGLNLSELMGYYGVLFLYVAITLAVQAGLGGSGVLAEEEQAKTTEFLYVRPISRAKIITQKLLAGYFGVIILWAVNAAVTLIMLTRFENYNDFSKIYWLFMAALAIIQTLFFTLGALTAAVSPKPKMPAKLLTGLVLLSYAFYLFFKLSARLEVLKHLSVFSAFDAVDIIGRQSLSLTSIISCLIFSVLAIAATYYFYQRRDLNI